MGRIKSKAIKRTAKELFEREEAFSSSFENNKKVLQSYTLPDKGTRNKFSARFDYCCWIFIQLH